MNKWLSFSLLLLCSCKPVSQSAQQKVKEQNYSVHVSQYGVVSLLAIDLASQDVIVAQNAMQRMTPASLTKIFTTGAGLSLLSEDFRYATRFYLVDESLHIIGSGDPTLGSDRFNDTKPSELFKNVLQALRIEGILSLKSILIDNSCYGGIKQPSKRLWEDMGNYYGAVPNGLSYRENTFYLSMQSPSKPGDDCRIIKVEPDPEVHFDCQVKGADNNKDSAYIYGSYSMSDWYVSGTIPNNRKSFTIKGALPHPEMTLAKELSNYLRNNEIDVNKVIGASSTLVSEKSIYTHYSPPLSEISTVINKKSHNLFADHLLFSIAGQQGEMANWDNGCARLSEFWKKNVPGFTGTFYDGSGLSPFNSVSTNDMVQSLIYLNHSPQKTVFKQSLSIAGVDGTLRSILREEAYKSKLIGKSGSMNGVLGYCGYIQADSGKEIAFCIIVNRFTESFKELRANIEVLMKEIIDQN